MGTVGIISFCYHAGRPNYILVWPRRLIEEISLGGRTTGTQGRRWTTVGDLHLVGGPELVLGRACPFWVVEIDGVRLVKQVHNCLRLSYPEQEIGYMR